MKQNQSKEDYLEGILLLSRELEFVHRIDLARRMGVSQPAVQKAVKLLQAEGLVSAEGMHIYLTQSGRSYAEEIYRRHCAIRAFLVMHGVNEKDADADACVMEHGLSQATYDMIARYAGKNNI